MSLRVKYETNTLSEEIFLFVPILLPVLARLHTSGQFSNPFHLHVGNTPLQLIVLSGRGQEESDLETLNHT